jgi:anti-anti-sigma regulatory factor
VGAVAQGPGDEWDGHVLLLHRSEDERLDGLAAWLRRGLDLGDKVICTETPATPEELLLGVLADRGVDVAPAVRDGRLEVLSAEEFYPPEGQAAMLERALAEGFTGVRLAGEVGAALTRLSPAAYRDVEHGMNELMRSLPVSALCQYPRPTTTEAALEEAVATHLFAVRQTTFATSPALDGLALRGEIEGDNTDVFEAVLIAASKRRPRVLWLDLAEVTYVDGASCWRLDDVTRSFRAAGGHLLLVAPQPPVELTMRLMEVDELPGVHLVGGAP